MINEEEIEAFLKEVMDKTYAFCKHSDGAISMLSSQLNGKAYRLLKKIERKKENPDSN